MQTFDVCSHSCSRSLCHHQTPYQAPPGSAASNGHAIRRSGILGGYTCMTVWRKNHCGWTTYVRDSDATCSIWPRHRRSRRRVDSVTRPALCRRFLNLCAVISLTVVANASHAVIGMGFCPGILFLRSMPLQSQLLFRRYAGMPLQTHFFGGSVKITYAAIANVGKTATCGMWRCRAEPAGISSSTVIASLGRDASIGM